MSALYIREQGSYIRKTSERITVCRGNEVLAEVPIDRLDNIAVFGNVQVTSQALNAILKAGIRISHFSYNGQYIGETEPDSSKNIFLRLMQYEFYQDKDKRLNFARRIVENKCSNQIEVICHHHWKDEQYDYKAAVRKIHENMMKIAEVTTSNELMGIEGICSKLYFEAFHYMLHCDFEFNGRNRRPPKDPVNILLSLTYTFLTREISSAMNAQSFELYLGFLHGIRYGRQSLSLDIIEEFRQPIADRFVINICNKRIINQFDFDHDTLWNFNEDGFKKYCVEYECWMKNAEGNNYRDIIKRQIKRLRNVIQENIEYVPYHAFEKEDESIEDDH